MCVEVVGVPLKQIDKLDTPLASKHVRDVVFWRREVGRVLENPGVSGPWREETHYIRIGGVYVFDWDVKFVELLVNDWFVRPLSRAHRTLCPLCISS